MESVPISSEQGHNQEIHDQQQSLEGQTALEEGTAGRQKTGKSNQSRAVAPASLETLLSTRSCLRLNCRQSMSILPVHLQHPHTLQPNASKIYQHCNL